MPSPGAPVYVSKPAEESFLELVAETLENLDRGARGQFLQRFFRTIAHVELTENVSLDCWEKILIRHRELSDTLGKPSSLKSAMVEVLASSAYLHVPVLMEYEDLKKLQINAVTDPLTGLYNRRFFEEHFAKELNRATRYNQHLALVLLDLHQFKDVNDRYGHPRGDLLLQTAASTLRKSLRTSDYAFRIGGDEFALLLLQSDTEQAMTLARRVRANFSATIEPMQMAVALGLDFGVAVYPADGDQKEALVRTADERLYEMKHAQRTSTAQPYTPSSRRPAVSAPGVPTVTSPKPEEVRTGQSRPEQRKWERVTLGSTGAYAQLMNDPKKRARVLDLGYGGVALEISATEDLAPTFFAVLYVPILPPVRVSLKRLYRLPLEGGRVRIGCSFVT